MQGAFLNEPKVINADCLEALRAMEDCSVDAVVTDPPYGLSNTKPAQVAEILRRWVNGDVEHVPEKRGGFMGQDWDSFVPPPAVWAECLRVLKPGGHMAVFAGARTQDLMGLSIRLAGFELRDTLGWVYGCLSEDTEVLINGEWVQYHKAKVGDLALCYNKEYDTYEWKPIEDTHKYEYGDTAYRIRSNNTDQLVSRNHRVLVERGGAYKFEYAENLAREHQIRVPILESLPTLLNDLSMREPLPSGEEQVLQHELRNVRPSTWCGETDGGARSDRDCVCRVRDEGIQAERLVEADENSDVLTRVQREVALGEVEGARTQGSSCVVRGDESSVRGESARGEQPGLERRRHSKTGTRELQGCSVCEVPAGAYEHGTQGRVCDGAPDSGGPGYRATPIADGSCASCESHAGGQSVGESVPVCNEPGSQAVRGARYTVADLASIEPVHYEGIVWCLTVPTGAFVARRNGKVFVTGNSGFPKSMDVSKAIDKGQALTTGRAFEFTEWMRSTGVTARQINEATGTNMGGHYLTTASQPAIATADLFDKLRPLLPEVPEYIERLVAERTGIEWTDYVKREVVGRYKSGVKRGPSGVGGGGSGESITTPSTDAAKQWEGWGTALKPAWEPIILARKPLDGTVAANVLAHGVGGLNIDGCRVATTDNLNGGAYAKVGGRTESASLHAGSGMNVPGKTTGKDFEQPSGRFPANVLLDEHAAKEMDEQSGPAGSNSTAPGAQGSGMFGNRVGGAAHDTRDSGGASRFFPVFKYQAKAPKKERPVIVREDGTKIAHPTVKPLALLDWLVTLITPPGGTILDPFAGTGTTLQAARNKGFNSIGIEANADYIELINQRIA